MFIIKEIFVVLEFLYKMLFVFASLVEIYF